MMKSVGRVWYGMISRGYEFVTVTFICCAITGKNKISASKGNLLSLWALRSYLC